jgi:integral membrane protein (TIGR01906 family)
MLLARWLSTLLFIVALPVFLVLTNVRIAASEPRVQRYGFAQYDAATVTGISRIELDRAATDIARYFSDNRETLAIRVQREGEEVALFNPREVEHMRDVKTLMRLAFRVHEIAFVYLAVFVGLTVLWTRERSLRRFAQISVAGGVVTAALLTLAAMAMLVGFDQLFLQFHLLSFSNDFWQLDPATDRLVQMFPQGFWFDVSFAVGVLSVMEGGIVALIGFAYLRWTASGPWRRGFGDLEGRITSRRLGITSRDTR